MKKNLIAIALVAGLFTSFASAGTVKVPKEESAATINIPDSWEPEEDGDGVLAESPDNVSTIYLEVVATEKEMDAAIDSSLEWLTKEHEVNVDPATKGESEFETGPRKWSRISWEGTSKEWGPAVVGFLFSDLGNGKILTVTYWISKKDSEKSLETLGTILASAKPIE